MTDRVFDRETLLDLTVNVIPLGILLFFFVTFVFVSPWGFDAVVSSLQLTIVGSMAILLTLLTYYAGRAISQAESRTDADADTATDEQAGPETA